VRPRLLGGAHVSARGVCAADSDADKLADDT
jgi:hypothetical protein